MQHISTFQFAICLLSLAIIYALCLFHIVEYRALSLSTHLAIFTEQVLQAVALRGARTHQ